MDKIKKLMWELFMIVRELENRVGEPGPTADHTRRQQQWAAAFHELEHDDDRHQAVDTADHDDEAEPAEDPHEHGAPIRPRTHRRKR